MSVAASRPESASQREQGLALTDNCLDHDHIASESPQVPASAWASSLKDIYLDHDHIASESLQVPASAWASDLENNAMGHYHIEPAKPGEKALELE